MVTKTLQFTGANFEAIERLVGKTVNYHKGWWYVGPVTDPGAQVRFLHNDWIINRDGVISAQKDKPRGV